MKTEPVTAAELARLLGIARGTVSNLASDGVLPRDGRGTFDPPKAVQAYIKYKVASSTAGDENVASLTAERSRLARLKADRAEIEAKTMAAELVPAADVQAAWLKIVGVVRSRILAIPTKLAARIIGLKTPAEAQALLKQEIDAALTDISNSPAV
jgi:phage terminase Nu1 subunit (DNA packaging protein)